MRASKTFGDTSGRHWKLQPEKGTITRTRMISWPFVVTERLLCHALLRSEFLAFTKVLPILVIPNAVTAISRVLARKSELL